LTPCTEIAPTSVVDFGDAVEEEHRLHDEEAGHDTDDHR
jgi:hypothetical protein